MGKFQNAEFGPLSRITADGVFCKRSEDAEERKIFRWNENDEEEVPILSLVKITPKTATFFWGKDGSEPSIQFVR